MDVQASITLGPSVSGCCHIYTAAGKQHSPGARLVHVDAAGWEGALPQHLPNIEGHRCLRDRRLPRLLVTCTKQAARLVSSLAAALAEHSSAVSREVPSRDTCAQA
jgi:hypothetical protein